MDSKSRTLSLKREKTVLERKKIRVQGQLDSVNRQLKGCESMCWSCEHTGPTMDLVECEIKNTNYPEACEKMRKEINIT